VVKQIGVMADMRKLYKSILLLILIYILIINISLPQKEITIRTNINTQHNTIVELYKYINLNTKSIPEEYLINLKVEKIKDDLSYRSKNYNSDYSKIEFIKASKEEKTSLIGKYIYRFNPKTVQFKNLEGDKQDKGQKFLCEVFVYYSEKAITNQIPLCNYNDNQPFNIKFNQKIKESIILSHINSLIYSYTELPLKLPEKSKLINNLTKIDNIGSIGNVIKEIKIIDLSEKETEFSVNFGSKITTDENRIKSFKKDNKIINIKLNVELISQYDINKTENCYVDLYQPWYLLLPDTLYSSVQSCESIK
jgi:hypothetical protein